MPSKWSFVFDSRDGVVRLFLHRSRSMVVARKSKKSKQLSEAALIAKTGISRRALIRGRQQGLIPTIAPRRGLGRGRGTTPIEYPEIAVATINRLNQFRRKN